ncbi:hypothetical protein BT67DRAFT_434050 [Trichocladium antarcticum]|uniref:Uncharacterized protein n=1 Tax=Trichocladium antarcticum TaxID=1450529 RepID=A0AAN6UMR3_9PEZI|nr:hypothetical protein BT67DRAFT_434050 [Trichocladium antarcticum]
MWPIVYRQFALTFDIFRHVHVSVAVVTIVVVSIIVVSIIARVGKWNAHPRHASWKRSLWALLSHVVSSSRTDFGCLTPRELEDGKAGPDSRASEKSTPWTVAPVPLPYDKSNVAAYQQRQHPYSGSVSKSHRQSKAPPAWTPAPDDSDHSSGIGASGGGPGSEAVRDTVDESGGDQRSRQGRGHRRKRQELGDFSS